MASFPTSVKSWTALVDGTDYPQAAQLNEARDEINAIEAGYLNGTARLNSSNSTVTNLSVTTDSTIGGALYVATPPPSVRVTNDADLGIANNVTTPLSFNAQSFAVPATMHSTATNPTRLVAPSSGVYLITGQALWNQNSSNQRFLDVFLNSTTIIADVRANASTGVTGQSVTTLYNLSSGDYVELRAYQNSGSTASISKASDRSPCFMMVKVR